MSEYSKLVSSFSERYEDPEVEPYIVGFSGIDPDKKIDPSVIPHDELRGILGGDVTGRYHLTNEQVADVRRMPSQIVSMESEISANKREAAQNLATSTQNLQSQITANKSSSDTEISSVKSRMSGLETRQSAYEGNLTSELSRTKSIVEAGLENFEETKDALNARMDYMLENSSDDMEVLDARTDAKNVTHPYLGKTVRSIHGEVLSQQSQIDTLKEIQHEMNDRQAEYRTDLDLEIQERKNNVRELQSAIGIESGRIDTEIRERSQAILNEQATRERALKIEAENRQQADTDERNARIQAITDEKRARKEADLQEQNERIEADEAELNFRTDKDYHLQEQANTLSDLSIIEAIRHYKNLFEVKALISGEKAERTAEDEAIRADIDSELTHEESLRESAESHLQSQIDELAESSQVTSLSIYKESQTRKEADINLRQEIQEGITNEADLRATSDEALSEDIEAAKAEALEAVNQETQERQESDAILQGDISTTRQEIQARGDYLQGQADILADLAISQEIRTNEKISGVQEIISQEAQTRERDLTHEQISRLERDEHLQEQADTLASAVIQGEINQRELEGRVNKKIAGVKADTEFINAHDRERGDFLQQQIDETSAATQQNTAQIFRQKLTNDEQAEQITDLQHEQKLQDSKIDSLGEQADDLAAGVIHNTASIKNEAQQRKETLAHFVGSQAERADYLQEQADLLSESGQNIISTLFKEVESRKTLENVIKEIRAPVDWSKAESIAIPEPRCAIVNFSGINSMPTSKTADIPAVMEFWDMQGNYFKKNISCSAQGNSSMGYIKKNVKFDLLNDDGSEFNLKIGGWVVQDGFHLKAYYTDFFRGVGAVSYKFYDEIMRFNGLNTDRPYKKVLLNIEEIATNALGEGDISDLELQLDTGALCHPDGFPCIVYLNGEFYGVFSWQIKKQRKNYKLDKSTVEHIHLDGSLYTGNFWNGVINWSVFEIRNPNKLYTMDGKKYDGDSPKELIDETSAKYDPSNKDHKRSAQVKKYIQDLVTNFAELKSLYSTYRTSDPDRVKAKYEELFDVDNQRDYLIFGDVIKNSDGFGKNWQWITYDGVKWFVTAYDLDMSFGGHFQGNQITAPLTGHITTSTAIPTGYIVQLYDAELKQRYQELRDAGIISTENIIAKLEDWAGRIGTANYELEYSKWPNSPCIKNYNDSLYRVKKWLDTEISNMDKIYGYTPKDDRTKQEIFSEVSNLLTQQDEINQSAREIIRSNLSNDISNQGRIRKDYDAGLQEQINILADMIRAKMLRERTESEELEARLTQIETALINGGVLEPSDIPVTTDAEISDRLDTILNLNS